MKTIQKLFGGGAPQIIMMPSQSTATPTPPPPVPTESEADATVLERQRGDELKRKKGRASTILTGSQGAGTPFTAAKRLTGE